MCFHIVKTPSVRFWHVCYFITSQELFKEPHIPLKLVI